MHIHSVSMNKQTYIEKAWWTETEPVTTKHLLTGGELSSADIEDLLEQAEQLRQERMDGHLRQDLAGKSLALLLEKPSLRTHLSFSVGMHELGGHVVESFALNRKHEEPEDLGRVIEGYCHVIVLRTHEHANLERMAVNVGVPVINGLSDSHHPCQILADMLTLKQVFGSLNQLKVAYVGDGNNILHSLMMLLPKLGAHLSYACPKGYEPSDFVLKKAKAAALESGGSVSAAAEPVAAVRRANAIYTDVWASMGWEHEKKTRANDFAGFQLNAKLYQNADPGAVIMHCLPMVRGEEITDEMADSPHSVIFKQSENRLHVQKSLLLKLLAPKAPVAFV